MGADPIRMKRLLEITQPMNRERRRKTDRGTCLGRSGPARGCGPTGLVLIERAAVEAQKDASGGGAGCRGLTIMTPIQDKNPLCSSQGLFDLQKCCFFPPFLACASETLRVRRIIFRHQSYLWLSQNQRMYLAAHQSENAVKKFHSRATFSFCGTTPHWSVLSHTSRIFVTILDPTQPNRSDITPVTRPGLL